MMEWNRSHLIASKLVKNIGIVTLFALVRFGILSFAENAIDGKWLKVAMIIFGIF